MSRQERKYREPHGSPGEQFPGGVCKDLSEQEAPSSLVRQGVHDTRGGKSCSTTCQEMPGKKTVLGEPHVPGLPSPGGKCYLHTTTHSHGPFSHPSPSSAICVEAVVFLFDTSDGNFGRKGEESQDIAEGEGLDRRWSQGRQDEAMERPENFQPPTSW